MQTEWRTNPVLGAFPARSAGNRAFRSNSSQKGRRPFCSGISAAIPCAVALKNAQRFSAISQGALPAAL
jgi:hypothetical protein